MSSYWKESNTNHLVCTGILTKKGDIMAGSTIVRDTIILDKKAREQIEELEKERGQIEDKLKAEANLLKKQYDVEVKRRLKEVKTNYQNEIKEREVKELNTYNKTHKMIEEEYEARKDKWVDAIYKACIDPKE